MYSNYRFIMCVFQEGRNQVPSSAFLIEVHSAIYHNVIGWQRSYLICLQLFLFFVEAVTECRLAILFTGTQECSGVCFSNCYSHTRNQIYEIDVLIS